LFDLHYQRWIQPLYECEAPQAFIKAWDLFNIVAFYSREPYFFVEITLSLVVSFSRFGHYVFRLTADIIDTCVKRLLSAYVSSKKVLSRAAGQVKKVQCPISQLSIFILISPRGSDRSYHQ
jgi:hypothetical protein